MTVLSSTAVSKIRHHFLMEIKCERPRLGHFSMNKEGKFTGDLGNFVKLAICSGAHANSRQPTTPLQFRKNAFIWPMSC